MSIPVDVVKYNVVCSQSSVVRKVASQVKAEVGDVDILINNAGIVIGKPILESTEQDIIKTFEVNVFSHFWVRDCLLLSVEER